MAEPPGDSVLRIASRRQLDGPGLDAALAQEGHQRVGAPEAVALAGAYIVQLEAQHGRPAGDAQHVAGQRGLLLGSAIGHAGSLAAERHASVNAAGIGR